MILKKVFSALIIFSMLTLLSCGKDDDTPAAGNYPKSVKIAYRVTGTIKKGSVTFVNATGGVDNFDDQTIPYSKEFTATVKQNDNFSINVSSGESGTVKVEILVDEKVVKTQSFSGNNVISGSIFYLFP